MDLARRDGGEKGGRAAFKKTITPVGAKPAITAHK
jgi:hypothetical protein